MNNLENTKENVPEVMILMSTYNGEVYIREQLDSILKQIGVSIRLVIRDDGSTDSTWDILVEYAHLYGEKIYLVPFNGENKGPANSFMYLLNYAIDTFPNVQYFGFADQDDYWLENKILKAIEKLKTSKKEALYFSRKRIVNNNLEDINSDDLQFYGNSFLQFLTISNAYGCTFLFNRNLAEICRKKSSNKKIYHDAWIYRVAGCIGATIYYDDMAYILYRQHESNVVGKVEYWNIHSAFKHVGKRRNHVLLETFQDIYTQFADKLVGEAETVVPLVANYKQGLVAKFRLMMWKEPRKYGMKSTIIWFLKVFFDGV